MAAGLILKSKFIVAKKGASFSGYVTYIDRPEAIKLGNTNYDTFKTYQDYMDNPEKTTGLFTATQDKVTNQGKEELKLLFDKAQSLGGLLNQSVISFESEWLKKTGLMRSDGTILEAKIREFTRQAVATMIREEGLESWVWSAAIHYNTKHVHIHIALADPNPSWTAGQGRCRCNKSGELYQRGKFKAKSLEKTKSTFINLALQSKDKNDLINDIIRNRIVLGKQLMLLHNAKNNQIQQQFFDLLNALPDDMRLWKYNMNAMESYHKQIDDLSRLFIKTYFQSGYDELQNLLVELGKDYRQSYGNSKKESDFIVSKKKDLYMRLGNAILKECRMVQADQRKRKQGFLLGEKRDGLHIHLNRRLLYDLKNVFQKDIETLKNQAAYERFLKEEEALYDQQI